jgi:hypothetical protein
VVDSDVQAIASAAGFVDYPETMEDFISGDWMSAMSVIDGISSEYTEDGVKIATTVYPSLYPEVEIPEGFDSISFWDITDQDSSLLTTEEYLQIVAYNLQNSYPDGFNSPVASVVELIDEKLDATITALEVLSTLDSISLEADMFTVGDFDAFTSIWPSNAAGDPVTVVIGESEILLSVASLQLMNSLLNSILAVDHSIDLATFYSAFNLNDGSFWGSDFLENQNGIDWNDELEAAYNWGELPQYPLSTGFLQTADDADSIMDESKEYMSDALFNLATAIEGIQARSGDSSIFTFSEAGMGSDTWSTVIEVVDVTEIFIDKLYTSLSNNVAVTIPCEIFSGVISGYDEADNWPADADWSVFDTTGKISDVDMNINLAALFDTPITALDNLIELNSNGEPVLYSEDSGNFTAVTSYDAEKMIADESAGTHYAIKVKDVTFGGLVEIPEDVVDDLVSVIPISSELTQEVDGSSISYYVNLVNPSVVFSALNTAGTETTTDTESDDYVKATGSFWYSIQELTF